MRGSILVAVLTLIAMFVSGTSTEGEEGLPLPESTAFWTYITKTNPYVNWALWPNHEGTIPGAGPHGAYIRIYVNEIARKAMEEDRPMSPGAIIVKENYAKDKEQLTAITPMYKVKDFNPGRGDWYWANYAPDGSAVTSGKVKTCINCHRVRKNNDYLFTEIK